ncbi:MAG: hypothetical protein ABI790_19040 [Betaproteobacteria bacterium]
MLAANVTMGAPRHKDCRRVSRIAIIKCGIFATNNLLALSLLLQAGCAISPSRSSAPGVPTGSSSLAAATTRDPAATPVLQRLVDEAEALQPLAQSALTRRFLDATRSLPAVAPRTVYLNEVSREYFSVAERSALPAGVRAKLAEVQLDEYRYYYTKYGSPLAYLRPLELAAANGIVDVAGKHILDFGYGGIGQLRLLASLGAHVTGIDPDSYLDALYSSGRDQGAVPPAGGLLRGHPGTITLAHGYWPKDPKMVERVGQGYDLVLSKNTLKKGYIKPERKIDKRQQIDLGVNDESFLRTIYRTLSPGGLLIIYNLYPKPPEGKGAYNPQADARSPYSRKQYEKAGLQVLAFNTVDHVPARSMGRALKWDRNDKGETITDLDINLYAMFTIVARPNR